MVFAIFNSIFVFIFLLSALVQYNDPDPVKWIAIYLSGVVMCILNLIHRQRVWLPPTLLLISLVWIAFLLPGVFSQGSLSEIADSPFMKVRPIEEAREAGGLLLVALWAAIVWVLNRRLQH